VRRALILGLPTPITLDPDRELTAIAAAESFRGDSSPNRERDMPLPIPPEFERAVLERVRSGRYASIDEVLQACLAGLAMLEDADEELRRELQAGKEELERGERLSREEVLARLREARTRPELRRFVEEQVESGRFNSAREVVEAGLVLLQQEHLRFNEELEALRREIDLGIESAERDELIPGDEVVARIRARFGGAHR
jgi:putative addiction module CopG family antidote